MPQNKTVIVYNVYNHQLFINEHIPSVGNVLKRSIKPFYVLFHLRNPRFSCDVYISAIRMMTETTTHQSEPEKEEVYDICVSRDFLFCFYKFIGNFR